MYTIHYASDVIRGRNNYGVDEVHENLSKNDIISFVNELDTSYGSRRTISGISLWKNKQDTHTVSIFNEGQAISYRENFND